MTQRFKYIDLGSAILLLYVLVFHAVNSSLYLWEAQMSSFDGEIQPIDVRGLFPFIMYSMPWFFYKAGMLFRVRGGFEQLRYDAKKMLKPLALYTFVSYAVFVTESCIRGTATWHSITYSAARSFFLSGYVSTNVPLWFLLTLFLVRQIGNISLRHIHPLIVAFAGLAISFVCFKIGNRLIPLWVANTGCGVCFFALGFYFNQRNKTVPENKVVQILAGILFVTWCVISYFLPSESIGRVPIVDMRSNTSVKGLYLLWFPVCLFGIWAFNGLMKAIENKLNFTFMNWLAGNAMSIYIYHGLVYSIVSWIVFSYFDELNPVLLFCLIMLSYSVMMLCIWLHSRRKNKVY